MYQLTLYTVNQNDRISSLCWKVFLSTISFYCTRSRIKVFESQVFEDSGKNSRIVVKYRNFSSITMFLFDRKFDDSVDY